MSENSSLIIGQRVDGGRWSGVYVGSWTDEGMLYDFFRDGQINGTPQRCFGHPAPDPSKSTVLRPGTFVDMGSPHYARVTEDGAVQTSRKIGPARGV